MLFALALLAACDNPDASDPVTPDDTDVADDTDVPGAVTTYDFDSRFGDGSSVAYDGQTFRLILIEDLKSHVGGLTSRLDSGWFPAAGDVTAELEFYLAFDSETSGSVAHGRATTPAPLQTSYDELSSGKDLWGKLAGNDAVGQHEDWTTALLGAPGHSSPEGLVRAWVAELDAAAVAWSNGDYPRAPGGGAVASVYVTADGRDLQQLLQKFLWGAIAWSQTADDYLDDDLEGKGINGDNTAAEDGKPWSALEHAWDEGFGYLGAARSYGGWDDALSAGAAVLDDNPADGAIDLLTEATFGHATAAAKRDLGAVLPQDWTADLWAAFVDGRALITATDGALDATQKGQLTQHRDDALLAWERTLAASAVHYLNAVIVHTNKVGAADYSFSDHAKHFSELKGYALSLQFNPHSAMSDEDQATLHALLRAAPELGDADARADYVADLLEARTMIGDAWSLPAQNLGGDDGLGGW
jgi:hypothetical protein